MGDMEDALSTLSSTLPEAFDETVSRIKRLPESRQRLAFTALLWVCQNRQITVAAVTEALSVRIGQNTIDEKYRPSVGTILDCCQGLVTVDKATTSSSFYDRQRMAEAADGDILRPVHQSVKEFFFSHRDQFLPNADAMLAEICLTYLILRKFPCGPCFTGPEIEARVARYPFLRYAANSWGYYVRVSQHDPRVRQLLEQFLDCRDEVASMSQISDYFLRYTEKYWSREEVYSLNALHVLCDEMVGPEDIVRDVLASGRFPVNAASSIGTTPLLKAVSGGNVSLVHLLIEYGADPFLANWYGNALDCAAEGGQAAVARELVLRHGMPLQRLANRHPLGCALDRDCDEVFEVLVDLGADLNAPVSRNMSVKAMAFLLGCERIVELMLRRSWLGDANEVVGDGMRPLHLAILGGSSAIVSSLVKAGADVDATTSTGVSALQLAAIHGNGELAAMLLEAGARPLAMGQENGYKAYLVEVYEDSEVDEDSEKD